MKKLIPPKRILRFLAAVLLLTAIIYSCKKDHQLEANNTGPDKTEVNMQQWLATQKTDSIIAYTVNSLLSQADWKTAHSLNADSGKVYEIVNLNSTAAFDDAAKTQQRYLTLIVQNGITTGFIYDLFGNKADLDGKADAAITNFNQNKITGFSGEITLSSWKNSVKKVKVYANGSNTQTRVLVSRPHDPSKIIQSAGKKVNGCTDWYWEDYENGTLVGEEYAFTTCDGGGGGGLECDAIGKRNSKGILSVKLNCEGASGGDNYEIYNNVTNPCLHVMVAATLGMDINSQISNLIKSVFGLSSWVNITYTDVTTLPNGTEGRTSAYNLDNNGNINIGIELNQNTLPKASEQYIATVIMHEAVHAYLMSQGTPDALQHETIATSYVSNLSASLQQMFSGLSANDATNLALGGLQNTTAFKNTISTDLHLQGNFDATQLAYSEGSAGIRCK